MSTETISAVLPRAADTAQRPVAPSALPGEVSDETPVYLEKLQATFPTEGHREENTGSEGRDLRTPPDARPQPVTYPSAAPSLPPPLVPIREVPPPEIPLPDELRPELMGAPPELEESVLGAEPAERFEEAVLVATATVDSPEPEAVELMPDDKGEAEEVTAERTLQKIVLSQGRESARVVNVDTEFAGEIFSTEA